MLTRWDAWYSADNLSQEERILAARPSLSAGYAVRAFSSRGKQRILDVACGVGRDTFFLEAQGLALVGVDASLNGIQAANRLKTARGAIAQFVTGDARWLPFEDGSFDGVYCFGLLHEFTGEDWEDNTSRVIAEFRRLLRPQGVLAIATLAGDSQDWLPHVRMFTRQMFDQVLYGWKGLEISCFDDISCTNRTGYHIWFGLFER